MLKTQKINEKSPLSWVLNLTRKIKERQDEITRRKIVALERKAYDYYLTLYIGDMVQNNKIDFHPELYLSGRIDCPTARKQANLEIQRIVRQGKKRINECFSVLLENARELREKEKKQKRIS